MNAPLAPHRPPTPRQRGVVATEMLLLMIVFFSLLMLGIALYRIRATDHYATTESQRETFERSVSMLNIDLPSWLFGSGRVEETSTNLNDPEPDDTLKITKLDDKTIEDSGTGEAVVYVGPPITADSAGDPSTWDVEIERYAYTIRPPWVWSYFPFVPTQDFPERNKVKKWYEDARKDPLEGSPNLKDRYKLHGKHYSE